MSALLRRPGSCTAPRSLPAREESPQLLKVQGRFFLRSLIKWLLLTIIAPPLFRALKLTRGPENERC